MFGNLTWAAIPFDQPIPLYSAAVVGLMVLAVLVWVVVKGHVPYLWREWITSVDHKRIGVMYCALALLMLLRGFIDALMMRSQQASLSTRQAICRRITTTRSSLPTGRS